VEVIAWSKAVVALCSSPPSAEVHPGLTLVSFHPTIVAVVGVCWYLLYAATQLIHRISGGGSSALGFFPPGQLSLWMS
jgi:hypothetical protein